MSKTIRRKNKNWDFHAYDYVVLEGDHYLTKVIYEKGSEEYKKAWSRYHRDTKFYRSSVPSYFIRLFCEKPLRQETRLKIVHWMKNPEKELMIPPFVHDAGYKYF